MQKTKQQKKVENKGSEFYGSAVVGIKGQIVIPQEARLKYDIKEGDKIIIFGGSEGVLALIKAENLQDMFGKLTENISGLV